MGSSLPRRGEKSKLTPVTRQNLCPVCEGDHKCSTGDDGLIVCGRRQSAEPGFICLGPAKGDPQFTLYRREGDPLLEGPERRNGYHPAAKAKRTSTAPGAKKPHDWGAEMARLQRNLTSELRSELAKHLKLPESILGCISIGYKPDAYHPKLKRVEPAFAFAETDAFGSISGIPLRFEDKYKSCVKDSQRGLTIPPGWLERPGPVLLPEGPSDVLALTAAGLAAIGRPSNCGGVELLASLFADLPPDRDIVFLAEFDPKADTGEWPGRDGAVSSAEHLAELRRRPVKWAMPPAGHKDARTFLVAQEGDWSERGRGLLAWVEDKGKTVYPPRPSARPASPSTPSFRVPAPYRPFPIEVIPDPLSEYVQEVALALGCDPSYVALPVLAAAAASIGNSRTIRLKGGWDEPSVSWSAVVGDSGTLKSPAFTKAVGHLFRVQ